MKRMKCLLGILVLTFAVACGQKADDTFEKKMYFTQPAYFNGGFWLAGVFYATIPTGGSITYPGIGIPVSTGTAWGLSIVNNSTLWNTAGTWVGTNGATVMSWGPHTGLYKLLAAKVDYVTEVINKPAEIELAAALEQMGYLPIPVKTTAEINATVVPAGKAGIVKDGILDCYKIWSNGAWRILPTTN